MSKIFVLLQDSDGTMRSIPEPFGVAVSSEEQAKEWAARARVGYDRGYQEVTLFDDWREAVRSTNPKYYGMYPEHLK